MAEQAGDRLPAGLAAQARHRFEEGQVGLARAMGLDTSSLSDAQPIATDRLGQEQLDERRLADPRLAGHEDDLPGAADRLLQAYVQLGQLALAADNERGRPRWRRPAVGLPRSSRRLDAGREPVAPAVARLDEARAPGVVGEGAAELLDARCERSIADHGVAPHGFEQLLPGDQ